MSVFLGGKKVNSLYIGGKSVSKAYYGGKLIFQKGGGGGGIPADSYGVLYYYDEPTGQTLEHVINQESDWNKICMVHNESKPTYTKVDVVFSFATIDLKNLRGFTMNPNPSTAFKIQNIPNGFMSGWGFMDRPVIIPDYVVSIGNNFLDYSPNLNSIYGRPSFSRQVSLGQGVQSVGNEFMHMRDGGAFNNIIDLGNCKTFGNNCINGLDKFNTSIDLTKIEQVGTGFMSNLKIFNKAVDISSMKSIGGMLNEAHAFNQNLTIPANCSFGSILTSNLRGKIVFSRTLTLENGVTNSGKFLWGSSGSFTVICNTDPYNLSGAGGSSSSMTTSTATDITQKYGGTYGAQLVEAFPNGKYESNSIQRKWVSA